MSSPEDPPGRRHSPRDLKEVREGAERPDSQEESTAREHRGQPGRNRTRTCPQRGHDAGVENQRAKKVCPDRVRTEGK